MGIWVGVSGCKFQIALLVPFEAHFQLQGAIAKEKILRAAVQSTDTLDIGVAQHDRVRVCFNFEEF